MATAIVKVGILAIKSVTKLVAKDFKRRANQTGTFRNRCIQYGQFSHRIESTISLRMMGHTVKHVKPLSEDAAVEKGYTILSEVVVLSTAIGLVLAELARKDYIDKEKAAKKKAEHQAEMAEVLKICAETSDEVRLLRQQVEQQELAIQAMSTQLFAHSGIPHDRVRNELKPPRTNQN